MKDTLKLKLKDAMKAQDKLRMETIRSILSEIQYEEMQKSVDNLASNDTVNVIQRAVKKRQEELQFAEQAKRDDLKEKLNKEIAIVEEFLPKQLSEQELEKIVTDMKGSDPGLNLSVAMKNLREKYAGQFDGKLASDVAKRLLT